MILNGDVAGGDRLRQDHIATEFGVSQMIVREAFKQLVAEGFLDQEPRRGVSVVVLNAEDADEMTQLRALLECQALEWAIPNQTSHDLKAARRLLDDLDKARSTDNIITLNARFHEALYAPAQRDRTLSLIRSLRLNFERYLRFTWDKTPHRAQSQAEHRKILSHCQDKNVDKACAVLRQHILATGDLLVKALQK
jgi:DNA-binding GntR family transcriptional regulator